MNLVAIKCVQNLSQHFSGLVEFENNNENFKKIINLVHTKIILIGPSAR